MVMKTKRNTRFKQIPLTKLMRILPPDQQEVLTESKGKSSSRKKRVPYSISPETLKNEEERITGRK